jgi:hypothetical protein
LNSVLDIDRDVLNKKSYGGDIVLAMGAETPMAFCFLTETRA